MSSQISDNGYSNTVSDAQLKSQKFGASTAVKPLSASDMQSQDTYASSSTQKNNTGKWLLGGLLVGVAALAVFKKDGEPLLKSIFKRGGEHTPAPHPTPRTGTTPVDESLVDLDPAAVANEHIDAADSMMLELRQMERLGRRRGIGRLRENRASRRNRRALGEEAFLEEQINTRQVQAEAIVRARHTGEDYARARQRHQEMMSTYRTGGASQNDLRRMRRAGRQLRQTTLEFNRAMEQLREANRTAAQYGN